MFIQPAGSWLGVKNKMPGPGPGLEMFVTGTGPPLQCWGTDFPHIIRSKCNTSFVAIGLVVFELKSYKFQFF